MDANAAVFFGGVEAFVVRLKVDGASQERGGWLVPRWGGVQDPKFQADTRHIFRLRARAV